MRSTRPGIIGVQKPDWKGSNNKIVIDDKFLRINADMVLIPEFVFTVGT